MTNVKNDCLNKAKVTKKDEFYTGMQDIMDEMQWFKPHFFGKVVYCNCDDPETSNFYKFFSRNFHFYNLKKLITTCYNKGGKGKVLVFDGENQLPFIEELEGDGDFRSDECIEFLKESDIVVTNPPFSLFREYVAQLIEYQKKFLIIGHQNAITYKNIFPLIKDNKVWLGIPFRGNVAYFESPYEDIATSSQHRNGLIRVSGVQWFTNMEHRLHNEKMILVQKYKGNSLFKKYDNYNAIYVPKTCLIPKDYKGAMGVPITFMNKYNPNQFRILGITDGTNSSGLLTKKYGKEMGKGYHSLNAGGCIKTDDGVKHMYQRILIQNMEFINK